MRFPDSRVARQHRLRDAAEQLAGRHAEAARNLEDRVQTRIAPTALNAGDLGLVQPRRPRQLLPRRLGLHVATYDGLTLSCFGGDSIMYVCLGRGLRK